MSVASDLEAERLGYAMQRANFKLDDLIEQEARGVIATLRFLDPKASAEEPTVDLVCGTSGIEREVVDEAMLVRFPGEVSLPVARVPHLIAMKVLSEDARRVQDRADLQALFAVASETELDRARGLVDLITERGFHRDLDLEERFNAFELEFGQPRSRGRRR